MIAKLSGVYAAVLTPRINDGTIDFGAFERQLLFLSSRRMTGFAINGATGEFPITSHDELELILESAKRAAPEQSLMCGIGGASLRTTLEYGRMATAAGVMALLLPMPYFFPYRQDDLIAYVSAVVDKVETPVLLYNLPQFTTGLEASSVLELARRHTQIIGVKDSSGSLDIVRCLSTEAKGMSRLIGNDEALAEALREGLCDGVVSGVACVLPELLSVLFESAPESAQFQKASSLLKEYIANISTLPTPWGLRVTSAVRKICGGEFPLPLSPSRMQEVATLKSWFTAWLNSSTTGELNLE